jgi:hypothetical protein
MLQKLFDDVIRKKESDFENYIKPKVELDSNKNEQGLAKVYEEQVCNLN